MKKFIAILLSLLMLLSMAACSKGKASEAAAPTAAPTNTPAPTAAPTNTPAPTAAPTNTPAPTEVPAELVVANALEKLNSLQSMRMDLNMLMDMTIQISASGMNIGMPMKMNMEYGVDIQKNPEMSKLNVLMDMDMGPAGQQSRSLLVYVDNSGESAVSYSSVDDGTTWTVESAAMENFDPQESYFLLKDRAKAFEKIDTKTEDGKNLSVYAGTLDGEYTQQLMASTGMDEILSEITGGAEENATYDDVPVIVEIDDESGYPVFYSMDMTDLLKDLLTAALKQSMGGNDTEGVDVTLDAPSIKVNCVLSQFDSVEPIVIPEAALAANN